jgi:hypothetical protein
VSPRERNMLIVLGVIVVAAGAFFLLTRGGGEPEEAAPAPAPPPQVAPQPDERPPKPPRTPTFFGGRDPFVPLVVAAAAGEDGAPTDGEPTDGEPTDGAPTDGAPADGGQPGVTVGQVAPPTGPGQRPGVTVGGHSVVVIDTFARADEEIVQVEVDGQAFTVGEGDRFAQNFQVVSIEGECATFLFGDESFTTCVGGRPK